MVEEINENNFRNLHKTQSVAELMAGRETSKQLPENFYEKVLELEIQLKKRFNMEVLQKLVEYYSVLEII